MVVLYSLPLHLSYILCWTSVDKLLLQKVVILTKLGSHFLPTDFQGSVFSFKSSYTSFMTTERPLTLMSQKKEKRKTIQTQRISKTLFVCYEHIIFNIQKELTYQSRTEGRGGWGWGVVCHQDSLKWGTRPSLARIGPKTLFENEPGSGFILSSRTTQTPPGTGQETGYVFYPAQ